MSSTTPLLLLLDGMLCRDREQISDAVEQITELLTSRGDSSPSLDQIGNEATNESPNSSLESVTKQLLEHFPHFAALPSSHDGSLPLHFAASLGDLAVARLILSKYPKGASAPNAKGKLPLHYAAREGHTPIVTLLLSTSPQTATSTTHKRKTPLHYAVGDGHYAVSRQLLQIDSAGAFAITSKGKVPLHFAARWGHVDILEELLVLHPEGPKCRDWEGLLPLHDAAREGQTEAACRLIEAYPEGLREMNMRGELPLLAAVRCGRRALVEEMVWAWPEGAKVMLKRLIEDDDVGNWDWEIVEVCLRGAVGMLAGLEERVKYCRFIHVEGGKGEKGRSVETDRVVSPAEEEEAQTSDGLSSNTSRCSTPQLTCSSPETDFSTLSISPPRTPDNNTAKRRRIGDTPTRNQSSPPSTPLFLALHTALECESSHTVIECVLRRHAEQVSIPNDRGMLPLHVAAEHTRGPHAATVLQKIIALDPTAAHVRDLRSRLPLHVALATNAGYPVIQTLLEANHAAGFEICRSEDGYKEEFPLVVATECGCELDVVFLLLRGNPGIVCEFV